MTSKIVQIVTVLGQTPDGAPTVSFQAMEMTLDKDGKIIARKPLAGELAPRLLHKALGVVLDEALPAAPNSNLVIATSGAFN